MELYAAYIKEREGKDCKYDNHSFLTYKVYDNEVSLIDIYTRPEKRGIRTYYFVRSLLKELYKDGVKTAYAYTDETTHNWERNESMILKFGFKKLGKIEENYNNYILNIEEII